MQLYISMNNMKETIKKRGNIMDRLNQIIDMVVFSAAVALQVTIIVIVIL